MAANSRQRGHRSGAGFTLLELLIVLVLIGVASAFSVAAVDRLAGRLEERRWADLTQQALAKLRNKAVMGGVVVRGLVDFDRGELLHLVGDGSDLLLTLPEKFRFSPSSLPGPQTQPVARLPLYFYPDGTMDDAIFELALPSAGRRRFQLTRFTGRIERTNVHASAQ